MLLDLEGLPVLLHQHLAEMSAYCLEPATEIWSSAACCAATVIFLCKPTALAPGRSGRSGYQGGGDPLHLNGENRQTLKLLLELVRQFPGSTGLKLAGYPGRHGWTYNRLSRMGVFFCSPLYQGLCKILPLEAIELFGHGGEALLVKAAAAADRPVEENEGIIIPGSAQSEGVQREAKPSPQ